ncbi:MAG: YfhO family protein, partial [Lachnospiraceae bacterium]|nr:YfhO family protein [Lachnospiraceae bacterium]
SFSVISLIDLFELPAAYLINSSNGSIFNTRPVFYCGWPALVLVIVYFTNRIITKREKIMTALPVVFLAICTVWHPAYLMMHAFDEPDSFAWRFSYLLVFALVTIACRAYSVLSGLQGNKTVICSTLILLIGIVFSVLYSGFKYGNAMISEGILAFNLLCIVMASVTIILKRGVVIYGLIELMVSGLILIPNFADQGDFMQTSQKAEIEQVLSGISEIKNRESGGDLYRIAVDYGNTYNFSMLFDYNANTFFSSLEDSRLWRTMYQLGYFARAQQISYFGATDFTDMLFSVRYRLRSGANGENVVMHNEMTLPVVFGVSDKIVEYSGKEDPFENQNNLASCMMEENIRLFSEAEYMIIPGEGIDWGWNGEKQVYQAKKTGEDSSLVWIVDTSGNKEAYTYCLKENLSAGLGDKTYIVSGIPGVCGSDTAIPFSGGCIVPMYELPGSGQSVATIFMAGEYGDVIKYKDLLCVTFDHDVLGYVYRELAEGSLTITAFQDGKIEGDVILAEERPVLFTSIPYDPGWEVFVDGKKTETFRVMDGTFLAVRSEPGEHHIKFVYRDKAFYFGICCSIVGMLMLLGMILFAKKHKKN